jgi:hypothetical protein
MLATVLLSRAGNSAIGATVLLNHAGDGAAGLTWLWCNVDAESCRWRCYRVMLVMALQHKIVLVMLRLCSTQARSINVLSQCEEVGFACQLLMMFVLAHSRVIAGKIS